MLRIIDEDAVATISNSKKQVVQPCLPHFRISEVEPRIQPVLHEKRTVGVLQKPIWMGVFQLVETVEVPPEENSDTRESPK